jgi:hypothetical protein
MSSKCIGLIHVDELEKIRPHEKVVIKKQSLSSDPRIELKHFQRECYADQVEIAV